jgi:hypothetical protein
MASTSLEAGLAQQNPAVEACHSSPEEAYSMDKRLEVVGTDTGTSGLEAAGHWKKSTARLKTLPH